MNPFRAILRLITAKRRAAQHHAEFIRMIRQAAALLSAGRALSQLWPEVAQAHQPCSWKPAPEDPDPGCCIHHVVNRQHAVSLLNQPYFAQVTGPGQTNAWQQLAATLTLAQHTGMSLSQVLYRLADALEAGEDAQQAREAASAGPKSTANLLAWLPVAGLGLAHMLGASIGQLLTSGTGWILLISGAALAAVGRIWTRRMMKTAEEP
ncbi:MAG: hypothetical protein L0K38_10775 [Yaniella sp.]|uniref:type II secretion system F family protein n=2 Tax=Yaniella sp. TaxID=2773929 RepID=UPI00264793C4|nr:hypothetical protein [Yaniella sp.]MDN6457519.1 hypothetical protein [Yaniella sp.]